MENGLEAVRGWDTGVLSVCSHFEHLLMKIEYQFAKIFASNEMQTFSADSPSCYTTELIRFPFLLIQFLLHCGLDGSGAL